MGNIISLTIDLPITALIADRELQSRFSSMKMDILLRPVRIGNASPDNTYEGFVTTVS